MHDVSHVAGSHTNCCLIDFCYCLLVTCLQMTNKPEEFDGACDEL